MIRARHHWIIYPFFQHYTRRILRKHFHQIVLAGSYEEQQLPILILANHISWWDGFWIMHLNLKVLHRKFHFMMLEDQLRKHWYFSYSGAFSVRKNSRSVIESLQYTSKLLEDPRNMVFIFPQGEITSMHQHNITFEKGVEYVLNGTSHPVTVLFVAFFIDYFSHSKPTLFIHYKPYTGKDCSHVGLSTAYHHYYQECLTIRKDHRP